MIRDPAFDATVVGNVEIFGAALRNFLQKSHYEFFYDPKTHTAELFANHNKGGESLIILRNVDYEVARIRLMGIGFPSILSISVPYHSIVNL